MYWGPLAKISYTSQLHVLLTTLGFRSGNVCRKFGEKLGNLNFPLFF